MASRLEVSSSRISLCPGLNALSGVVGPQYSGLAKSASGIASSLGYGRRRVRGGALSLADLDQMKIS